MRVRSRSCDAHGDDPATARRAGPTRGNPLDHRLRRAFRRPPGTTRALGRQRAGDASKWLATMARELSARLTVISSDVVFAGPRMFHDESSPPASSSPRAKYVLAVEQAADESRHAGRPHARVRLEPARSDASFAERAYQAVGRGRCPVAADGCRHATPILATDLAPLVGPRATSMRLHGLYHLVGAERTSPHRFACELAAACGGRWDDRNGAAACRPGLLDETSLSSKRLASGLEDAPRRCCATDSLDLSPRPTRCSARPLAEGQAVRCQPRARGLVSRDRQQLPQCGIVATCRPPVRRRRTRAGGCAPPARRPRSRPAATAARQPLALSSSTTICAWLDAQAFGREQIDLGIGFAVANIGRRQHELEARTKLKTIQHVMGELQARCWWQSPWELGICSSLASSGSRPGISASRSSSSVAKIRIRFAGQLLDRGIERVPIDHDLQGHAGRTAHHGVDQLGVERLAAAAQISAPTSSYSSSVLNISPSRSKTTACGRAGQ